MWDGRKATRNFYGRNAASGKCRAAHFGKPIPKVYGRKAAASAECTSTDDFYTIRNGNGFNIVVFHEGFIAYFIYARRYDHICRRAVILFEHAVFDHEFVGNGRKRHNFERVGLFGCVFRCNVVACVACGIGQYSRRGRHAKCDYQTERGCLLEIFLTFHDYSSYDVPVCDTVLLRQCVKKCVVSAPHDTCALNGGRVKCPV